MIVVGHERDRIDDREPASSVTGQLLQLLEGEPGEVAGGDSGEAGGTP
jgi:hypothetical protein